MEHLNKNATNEEVIEKINEIINFLNNQSTINIEMCKLLGNILKTQNFINLHCINGFGEANVI